MNNTGAYAVLNPNPLTEYVVDGANVLVVYKKRDGYIDLPLMRALDSEGKIEIVLIKETALARRYGKVLVHYTINK